MERKQVVIGGAVVLVIIILGLAAYMNPTLLETTAPTPSISIDPTTVAPKGSITVAGTGFRPNKLVTVWALTANTAAPKDNSVAVGISKVPGTNSQGAFVTVISLTSPSGLGYLGAAYILAIDYDDSQYKATADFTISAGGGTAPTPNPMISVSSNIVNVGDSLTVTGNGFAPNVAGALVQLYMGAGDGVHQTPFYPTTDATGNFQINVQVQAGWVFFPPPNNLFIRAFDVNYGLSSNTVIITVNNAVAPSTITVFVTVRDQKDFPVVGATVTLGTASAFTDATGIATIHLVATGTYPLTIKATGFDALSKVVQITGPSSIPVNLTAGSVEPPTPTVTPPSADVFVNNQLVGSGATVPIVSPAKFRIMIKSTAPMVTGVRIIIDGATYPTTKSDVNTYESQAIALAVILTPHNVRFEYLGGSGTTWSTLALLSMGETSILNASTYIMIAVALIVVAVAVIIYLRRR